jgi:hypothetical protein
MAVSSTPASSGSSATDSASCPARRSCSATTRGYDGLAVVLQPTADNDPQVAELCPSVDAGTEGRFAVAEKASQLVQRVESADQLSPRVAARTGSLTQRGAAGELRPRASPRHTVWYDGRPPTEPGCAHRLRTRPDRYASGPPQRPPPVPRIVTQPQIGQATRVGESPQQVWRVTELFPVRTAGHAIMFARRPAPHANQARRRPLLRRIDRSRTPSSSAETDLVEDLDGAGQIATSGGERSQATQSAAGL